MNKEQVHIWLQDVDALNVETLNGVKQLTQDYPWFTTGWLLYVKNLKNVDATEYEEVLKRVALMVPDRKIFYKFLNSSLPQRPVTIEKLKAASSVYELDKNAPMEDGNTLIDRFLNSNNENIRRQNDPGEKEKLAKTKEVAERSVAENDELITETLAAIYYQQKNYQKAQEAYQKLSLKYPEKSVYFASRIKEIEVLKNNN